MGTLLTLNLIDVLLCPELLKKYPSHVRERFDAVADELFHSSPNSKTFITAVNTTKVAEIITGVLAAEIVSQDLKMSPKNMFGYCSVIKRKEDEEIRMDRWLFVRINPETGKPEFVQMPPQGALEIRAWIARNRAASAII